MEELKRFQGSTFDEFSRTRLIEDRDTILEFMARIQELQHEVNCMNVSRDSEDAEYAVDCPTFPLFRDPGGMLSRSVGMPSRNDGPPDSGDTHGKYRETFCICPPASSSSPRPGGFNPWISDVTEDTSPHVMSERQTPVQDSTCQSGPSARNSFDPEEGSFSKDYRADQQRLQISDLHFDKFLTPQIRFKTEWVKYKFIQNHFHPGPKGWRPKGWGPEPRKRVGARRVWAGRVGARRGEGQNFALFFPSPAPIFILSCLFFSLWVFSRVFFPLVECWSCFGWSGPQMCLFLPSRPKFHEKTSRERTKDTRRHPEREKKNENGGWEKKKKNAKFWAVGRRAVWRRAVRWRAV